MGTIATAAAAPFTIVAAAVGVAIAAVGCCCRCCGHSGFGHG